MTAEPSSQTAPKTRGISADVKLLAALASLVILLVIGIALAIIFIIMLGASASAVERQARYSAAIDAAALYAKSLANDERGYLIAGNEEFLADIDSRTELAREAFKVAAEAASAEQRATLAEARDGFERWLDTLERELATYQAGGQEAAIETSLGPSRTLRNSYEGWLADAQSLGVDAFQESTASLTAASSLSVLVLLAYLVAAVGAAVGIALWPVRAVLRPTSTLTRLLGGRRRGHDGNAGAAAPRSPAPGPEAPSTEATSPRRRVRPRP